MPRVWMVRHGQAAAGWGDDLDPGLSDVGRAQATAAADSLAHLGPLPIVVSPMRRCRETAAPLAARWGVEPVVDAAVGEIVSPTDAGGLEARAAWLAGAMAGCWADLGDQHRDWRRRVLDRLARIETDTVVHSHFIAINLAVGAARGDDRLVCFRPDHCSWTVIDVDGRDLSVVELGAQATTEVR